MSATEIWIQPGKLFRIRSYKFPCQVGSKAVGIGEVVVISLHSSLSFVASYASDARFVS